MDEVVYVESQGTSRDLAAAKGESELGEPVRESKGTADRKSSKSRVVIAQNQNVQTGIEGICRLPSAVNGLGDA